ncbi:hypothetical protein [Wenyingzhuangia sp. 2_MG-2023]|uniref:hypothetical protein n=1 Tax=Wenyingzhuangia sp. 2_MG-2023 TaxID=3062639 RepID=UPI0026E241BD|nr:hypothetical protein [Wenyingzhuangia sp. 2_MG-2023]
MSLPENFNINDKLENLAKRENELYSAIIELSKKEKSKSKIGLSQHEIFNEYALIHENYAILSEKNIEALKRGLFIQWYCYVEPDYLTGIRNLNKQNENLILSNLKIVFCSKNIDKELLWMTSFYIQDNYLFDLYIDTFNYKKYVPKNESKPSKLLEYEKRGQMGIFWNSIINR